MSEIVAKDQLKQYVKRIERLEADKTILLDDIKQVFDEAKANGFDVKTMKKVVQLRKLDKTILELYRQALEV